MAVKIDIQPVKVLEFPQEKYAHSILIEKVEVKLTDQGVLVVYHLLDKNNSLLYQNGLIELANEEVSNWTNTDEELIEAVLNKLNLTKA